jgi:23S rRNA pseudouridine2605 synthase
MIMQLNRFIAQGGICSRRKATDLIKEGLVMINGITMSSPVYRVQEHDSVYVNGRPVVSKRPTYVVLNKPKGYLTTCSDDEGRPTVLDLCSEISRTTRLFPVGRLDGDSSGLLLLTNDGDMTQRLSHPRYEMQKWYRVKLGRPLDDDFCQALLQGIRLFDGVVKVDKIKICHRNRLIVNVWLHCGRNRIVRRLFGAGGYPVSELTRIGYASLTIRRLACGTWRHATRDEIDALQRKTGLKRRD